MDTYGSNSEAHTIDTEDNKNISIPDITIFRINNWVYKEKYDHFVMQSFQGTDENIAKVLDQNGDIIDISTIPNSPESIILGSGYEISKKDILECKSFGNKSDPLRKLGFIDDEYCNDNPKHVSFVYNFGHLKYILKFIDHSIKDDRSMGWNNRNIWIFRTPVNLYKIKNTYYAIISDKYTAPPSVHIKFNMGLTEDISGYQGEDVGSDTITKISMYENGIFKRIFIDLEIYYTLFLGCPDSIFSAIPQKIGIIDNAYNPSYALNCVKYLLKSTSNHILILLVADEKPEVYFDDASDYTKNGTSSHNYEQIQLETLVDNNPNTLMLISQLNDKNYVESFEEATKTLLGPGGYEGVIDFHKQSKLLSADLDFYTYSKIIFENMDFNSNLVGNVSSYTIDPNLVLLMSIKCINLKFKNFTTFLLSTKYDLNIISYLTQIIKAEKQRIMSQGLIDRNDYDYS